jgi:signal transduction histidine kinase
MPLCLIHRTRINKVTDTPSNFFPQRPVRWTLRTLGGRLTAAFVIVVVLGLLSVAGAWKFYFSTTFERGSADMIVTQIRAVLLVADQLGDNLDYLQSALNASGLQVQIDGKTPPDTPLRPLIVTKIEAHVSQALGQPVRLVLSYVKPRKFQAVFLWKKHELTLTFPLNEWEIGMPIPLMSALMLILLLAATMAALAILWIQRPLKRLASDIAEQRLRPSHLVLPRYATEEVEELVLAYNRVVDEIELQRREREQILAGVSHDLKSPLARLRLRAVSVEDPVLADGIVRDVLSLDRIADQFLNFVRSGAETTQGTAHCAPLSAIEEVATRYRTRGLEIRADKDIPFVYCDALSFERILVNLLDNAYEYGRLPVQVRITTDDDAVQLMVSDAGEGISQEMFAHAAEPFVRLDTSRGQAGHCGLGLAIVTRLAAQSGGKLIGGRLDRDGFEIGVSFLRVKS